MPYSILMKKTAPKQLFKRVPHEWHRSSIMWLFGWYFIVHRNFWGGKKYKSIYLPFFWESWSIGFSMIYIYWIAMLFLWDCYGIYTTSIGFQRGCLWDFHIIIFCTYMKSYCVPLYMEYFCWSNSARSRHTEITWVSLTTRTSCGYGGLANSPRHSGAGAPVGWKPLIFMGCFYHLEMLHQ